MLKRDSEEDVELLSRSAPASFILCVVGIDIGLVPDLPIFHIVMIAVRPAFSIVTDDMLTYYRPLFEVLRGQSAVFLRFVLDVMSKTVEMVRSCVLGHLYIFVGAGKIVICGIVGIRIEVRKHGTHVDRVLKTVSGIEGCVVISRVGYSELLVKLEIRRSVILCAFAGRTVVYTMQGLDFSKLPAEAGDELRIVFVGDYDACPCIGAHVENTKETGRFVISSWDYENGRLRIRFKLEK